jgi:hypothetical protein
VEEHRALQENAAARNSRRRQYFVGVLSIVVAVGFASLARLEPSIYGFKWLLIFACGGVGSVAGVFKLRRLIHGTGWVFPHSDVVILFALAVQCWLYLLFTHALWK